MTASTVTGTLVNPAAGALTGAQVAFTLVDYNDQAVAGFDPGNQAEVIDTVAATPDPHTGAWTVQLAPNAGLQLFDEAETTAYRVVETSAGATSAYWIVVTDATPSWVGDLRTLLVSPGVPATLPGTWCSLTDVATYTTRTDAVQQDVTVAQVLMEALTHRVWRVTDAAKRDYYWLTRATAWQAVYVHDHPEVLTMMDVSSIGQDGLSIAFRQGSQSLVMYSPVALRILNNLFRASSGSIRFNSAFQKNRLTKVGVTAGSSIPWGNL